MGGFVANLFSIAELTGAIKEAIDADIRFDGMTVEVAEWLNRDADVAHRGWIGIYRQSVDYDPHTLGRGTKSWLGTFEIKIILQACDYRSGYQCEVLIEERIKSLLDIIFESTFIRSHVQMINSVNVATGFVDIEDVPSAYFQESTITINCESHIDVT
jgi:hypothetical protein